MTKQPVSATISAIAKATGMEINKIQPFLDSHHGQQFLDELRIALDYGEPLNNAIEDTIERWMPNLTTIVGHCATMAESEAA